MTVIFQITILLILGEDAQPWFTAVVCNLEVQSRIFSGRKASTGYLFDLLYLHRFLQWILPMLLISLGSIWWIWQKQVCLDDALGDPCFVAHPPYSVSSFRPQFKVCSAKATRPIQRQLQFYHTSTYIYIHTYYMYVSVYVYIILHIIYIMYLFMIATDYCRSMIISSVLPLYPFCCSEWTHRHQPSLSLSTRILNLFVSAIIYRWKDTRRDAEEFSIAGAVGGVEMGGFGDGQWSKKSHPLVNIQKTMENHHF